MMVMTWTTCKWFCMSMSGSILYDMIDTLCLAGLTLELSSFRLTSWVGHEFTQNKTDRKRKESTFKLSHHSSPQRKTAQARNSNV
jgi:hypothetical protein